MRRPLLSLSVLALVLAACSPAAEEPGAQGGATPGAVAAPPSQEAAAQALPAASWSPRARAPLALTEVAAAPFAGLIWVAGGYAASGQPVADVQLYDPVSDTWSTGPSLPQPLHHTALVAAGDLLYVVGGYTTAEGVPTDAVHVLSASTGTWEQAPSLPEARAAGAAVFDGTRVLYGGGVAADGSVAGDLVALRGDAWEPVGALASPREHLAAASDGQGTAWFLGGRRADAGNLADVDVVQGEQVRPTTPLPTPRGGISGFHTPTLGGCAAGGESGEGTFVEVECVSADGTVTVLPPLLEPRHGIGAVALEGNAYVLLGGPQPGLTVSDTVQVLRLP